MSAVIRGIFGKINVFFEQLALENATVGDAIEDHIYIELRKAVETFYEKHTELVLKQFVRLLSAENTPTIRYLVVSLIKDCIVSSNVTSIPKMHMSGILENLSKYHSCHVANAVFAAYSGSPVAGSEAFQETIDVAVCDLYDVLSEFEPFKEVTLSFLQKGDGFSRFLECIPFILHRSENIIEESLDILGHLNSNIRSSAGYFVCKSLLEWMIKSPEKYVHISLSSSQAESFFTSLGDARKERNKELNDLQSTVIACLIPSVFISSKEYDKLKSVLNRITNFSDSSKKRLVLRCFGALVAVAGAIVQGTGQSSHPLVQFVQSKFAPAFDQIQELLFRVTSESSDPVADYNNLTICKIRFVAYGFILFPNLVLPYFQGYLAKYQGDLYGYYVIFSASRDLLKAKNKKINELFYNKTSLINSNKIMEHIIEEMVRTSSSRQATLDVAGLQAKDTKLGSLRSPAPSLCRRVYNQFLGLGSDNWSELLALDDLYIEDKVLLEDPDYFKLGEAMVDRSSVFLKHMTVGFFDPDQTCQVASAEALGKFIRACINHRYYTFFCMVKFMSQLFNQCTLTMLADTTIQLRVFHFVGYCVYLYHVEVGKAVKRNLIFRDPYSKASDAFIQVFVAGETYYLIALTRCTPRGFASMRNTFKFLSFDHTSAIVERIKDTINPLIVNTVNAPEVLVRSPKLVYKEAMKLMKGVLIEATTGTMTAMGLVLNQVRLIAQQRDPSSVTVSKFGNLLGFLAIASGAGLPVKYHDEIMGLPKDDARLQFMEWASHALNTVGDALRTSLVYALGEYIDANVSVYLFNLMSESMTRMKATSTARAFTPKEFKIATSYLLIVSIFLKRIESHECFKNSPSIYEICETAIHIVEYQYLHDQNSSGFADYLMAAVRCYATMISRQEDMRISGLCYFDKINMVVRMSQLLDGIYFTHASKHKAQANLNVSVQLLTCLENLTDNLVLGRSNLKSEKELFDSRSIMFGGCFNTFNRVLTHLEETAQGRLITHSTQYGSSAGSAFEHLDSDSQKIASGILKVLGNLVYSNYDVAAPYMVKMLSTTDPDIQTVHLQVFKNAYISTKLTRKLEDLPTITNFVIQAAISSSFSLCVREFALHVDSISKALYHCFRCSGRTVDHVNKLVRYEFDSGGSIDVLRKNTVTTKLLSLAATEFGKNFLEATVGVVLDELITEKHYFSEHPPPGKIAKAENSAKFLKYFTRLTSLLCESVNLIPDTIKEISNELFETILEHKKDDHLAIVGVGTFFFLRFVCPALANPQNAGLLQNTQISPAAQTCIIILAKSLQNAVNGSFDPRRFTIAQNIEEQINAQSKKLVGFIREISQPIYDAMPEIPKAIDPDAHLEHTKVLYTFVVHYTIQIRKNSLFSKIPHEEPLERGFYTYGVTDKLILKSGLNYINFQPDVATPIRDIKDTYPDLYLLVNKAVQDTSYEMMLEVPFFSDSIADDGIQVFTINCLHLSRSSVSSTFIAVRILQAIMQKVTLKFKFVIDCTLYNEPQSLPGLDDAFDLLAEHIPNVIWTQCDCAVFVNVSDMFFQKSMSLLERLTGPTHFMNPKFTRVLFMNAITDSVAIKHFNLKIYPIPEEGDNFINDVLYKNTVVPINLRFTSKYVIYSFGAKTYRSNGVVTVNIEPLSDWKDLQETTIPNEFSVLSSLRREVMYFASFKSAEVLETFYLKRKSQGKSLQQLKPSSTTDMIGEVLVAAGVGMMSQNPSVRKSAYTLFAQLKKHTGVPTTALGGDYVPPFRPGHVRALFSQVAVAKPQLTRNILGAFVARIWNKQDYKVLYYVVAPFLLNMYKEMYLVGLEKEVRDLFSTLLDNLPSSLSVFVVEIWHQLMRYDAFSDIAVDEILNKVVSGADPEPLAALLTTNSTIRIGNYLVRALIKGAYLPLRYTAVPSQLDSYWLRTEFLIRALVAIVFENPVICTQYLGELFFICAVYQRTGPSTMKPLTRDLFINTINSIRMTRGPLSRESDYKITGVVMAARGQTSGHLFGIGHNQVAFTEYESLQQVQASLYSSLWLNECVLVVISIPEFKENNGGDILFMKLLQLSFELSMKEMCAFSLKGAKLLGTLSAQGGSEIWLQRLIDKLIYLYSNRENSLIFQVPKVSLFLYVIGQMLINLRNSIYHDAIRKIGTLFLFSDIQTFTESGVFIYFTAGPVPQYDTAFWDNLNGALTQDQVNFGKESDIFALSSVFKCLYAATSSVVSEGLFGIGATKFANKTKQNVMDLRGLAILIPLYVLISDESKFDSFLKLCGLHKKVNNVPSVIVDYLTTKSKNSVLTAIVIAKVFTLDNMASFSTTRILRLFVEVSKKNPELIQLVFPIIGAKLAQLCGTAELVRHTETMALIEKIQMMHGNLETSYKAYLKQYGFRFSSIDLEFRTSFEKSLKSAGASKISTLIHDILQKTQGNRDHVF